MLLEDVPVGMSEQDNELIKHYTFDNKNDSNVFHLDIALQVHSVELEKQFQCRVVGSLHVKIIYLKCHVH